jgi:hypothetical protein
MEELMNNIRNEVLGFQSFIKKGKSLTIDSIKKRIQLLKETAVPNQAAISELEARLNVILDVAGREELEKHHLFEILNNEKITPAFIKLSKSSYTDALLTDIKGDDGEGFNNPAEQKEYIYKYFSKVYKRPDSLLENYDGCIESFLGPDILQSNLVKDSKLTAVEGDLFEGDLTLDELDESIKGANKSACGRDGLTNCFTKRFWYIFRIALCNYSSY